MRRYQLTVGDLVLDSTGNPNAMQIEFTLEEANYTPIPGTNSTLTIYGVPWEWITESYNFTGKYVTLYAGMGQGLPLASYQARNYGFLMQATVYRCWGNWIGTEMSLGFSFAPAGGKEVSGGGSTPTASSGSAGVSGQTQIFNQVGPRSINTLAPMALSQLLGSSPIANFGNATSLTNGVNMSFIGGGVGGLALVKPINLVWNLQPNQWVGDAIKETLARAFPNVNVNLAISQNLRRAEQDAGMYQSMEQFAQYIQQLSNSILGTQGYLGVHFSSHSNTMDVWDGTQSIGSGFVDALDLIGQPTWIDINKVSVKVVMRAGLNIGKTITLPQTLFNVAADSNAAFGTPIPGSTQRTRNSFSGDFIITRIVHIGDFRSPDGANWSTNIEAIIPGSETDQVTETSGG